LDVEGRLEKTSGGNVHPIGGDSQGKGENSQKKKTKEGRKRVAPTRWGNKGGVWKRKQNRQPRLRQENPH